MREKVLKIVFPIVLVITLFSFWAAFALLFVNEFFYNDLDGYVKGQICIYEVFAMLIAILIGYLMIKYWGNVKYNKSENQIAINFKYAIYFFLAVIVAVWRFWVFSQSF